MRTLAERFWAKVLVGAADQCWPWMGASGNGPYGDVWLGNGKKARAHRVSWELTNGPIPEGLFVCHSCDNPPCVNPAHLWLGTLADNNRDAMAKGRLVVPNAPRPVKANTHCPKGHEFTAQDTEVTRYGSRVCVMCRRLRASLVAHGRAWDPSSGPCCDVDHLRPTRKDSPPACKHGHELTPENTYIVPEGRQQAGRWICITCHKAHNDYLVEKRRNARKAALATAPGERSDG